MPFATWNDATLFYNERGARGLPIIFVHGAGSNHLIWGAQVRALGDLARAIAVDLPGHGQSSPPGRDTIDAYRDAVLGLLDALALDRAIVVGHSMGGAIAQTLALSHPDRVAGLGLVGTGARLRVLPAILDGILSPSEFDVTVRLIVEYSFAPSADAAWQQLAEAQLRACPPQVTHGDFVACNAFDVMPRLAEIRARTLVLCGTEDRLTPVKYSEFLAAQIPHARLTRVAGAGHSVMLERAEEVNRALVEFVRMF